MLDFLVRRYANFFHFVSHLAEIPLHPYRQAWLEETGCLTKTEEDFLFEFTQLMKRYPIDTKPPEKGYEHFLQKPFTLFDDECVWEEVQKWVDHPSDFETIKQIFAILEPRFERVWQNDQPLLESWKNELHQFIPLDVHVSIAKVLHSFHQSVSTGEKLEVYLLFSLESRLGGSGEIGVDRITLHCSRVPRNTWGYGHVLWTLYHEWTHTFQWDYLLGLILDFVREVDETDFSQSKAAQETGGLIGFFIEALARIVASYIIRQYYPQVVGNSPGSQLNKPQEVALDHLVAEYINGKKPVDMDFLREFWSISYAVNYDVL